METVWSVLIDGVWGPNAHHNHVTNGGPECASQSTAYYKLVVNAILVNSNIFCINISPYRFPTIS